MMVVMFFISTNSHAVSWCHFETMKGRLKVSSGVGVVACGEAGLLLEKRMCSQKLLGTILISLLIILFLRISLNWFV